MKISQSIDEFVASRLAEGYAPVTLVGYCSSLKTLIEFLSDPEFHEVKPENLRAFMHYLHTDYKPERPSGSTNPLSTASYHRYWKAIRCYFKWAADEFQLQRPDMDLKMPRYTNREIVPFSQEELEQLLNYCGKTKIVNDGKRKPYSWRRPLAARNKALILLLLDTGMRSGECSRLQIRDVNLEKGELRILPYHVGKTRPRTNYLGKSAQKALKKYLEERGNVRPEDPLFATMLNKPMTQARINRELAIIGQAAGVDNVHPHRFRHTFAIQFLRNGGDVFTLQRLLGHSTFEMMRRYLALADSDSAEAHRKSSPVDRWGL